MGVNFKGGSLDGVEYDFNRELQFGDTCWHAPPGGPNEKYFYCGGEFVHYATFRSPVSPLEYDILTVYPRLPHQGGFMDYLQESGYAANYLETLKSYTPLYWEQTDVQSTNV
jgi:hypothetical protein